MNLSIIEQTILQTIVYFDLFSYPLTELEIWKWQFHEEYQVSSIKYQVFSLDEIVEALQKSEGLKSLLDFNGGFYFLKGREDLVEERKRRYVISDYKLKRARFWIRFLQYAPFVQAIAICNNLSYHNAKDSSDIDLLVIAEPEHIWTARFFLTGFLKLFRLRPGDRKNYDGLCPSFFVSSRALDMEPLALKGGDPHFAFLTNDIAPIAGQEKYFEKFSADNLWIKENLPAGLAPLFHPRRQLKLRAIAEGMQKISEMFFLTLPLIEKLLEKFQRRILPDELARLAKIPDSGVFISSDVLKFHKNDRRAYFREKFKAKLKELCI